MHRVLAILLLAALVPGCSPNIPEDGRIPLDQLGRGAAGTEGPMTGTVLEQVPAGQYVYLRLKTASGETWAAVTATAVETGQQVTVMGPMLMKDFESTTLKRTFDAIYFGELAPSGAAANPHAGGMQSAPSVNVGQVRKASGTDARTVAEAWAQKETLDGKTVSVRGVVVKVTEGVMDRNWLHLQDGSGDAAQGTNDIAVVSTETAALGETVTITGTVRTNRDIGAGYSFSLLVEDAKVVRK